MRRSAAPAALLLVLALAASCAKPAVSQEETPHIPEQQTETEEPVLPGPMTVSCPGAVGGILDDRYGKRGEMRSGVPVLSPPLVIENAPAGTAFFALVMKDPDSVPLCGYAWVHWLAADIPEADIPEDASRTIGFVQGVNDFGAVGYGGPTPPDRAHTYLITVWALDGALGLQEGFSEGDLIAAMEGHILAEASLEAVYDS